MVTAWRLGALITMFLVVGLAEAAVSAQVDRTELYNDESLVLTVTVSPAAELNSTDLAALASLFSIEQRVQQQSSQNINGRARSRVDYQFRLSSKARGVVAIPSIRAGDEQSEPIFVTVLDARQRGDSLAEDAVQFTGRLSNNRPYV
ncbi:MAG: BatD family protein, partial [Reinekea forsetii]|nr:BatD family protein [Reinekea forsetii]